jgi:hypothetical protein
MLHPDVANNMQDVGVLQLTDLAQGISPDNQDAYLA